VVLVNRRWSGADPQSRAALRHFPGSNIAGNRIGIVLPVAGEREPSREVDLDGTMQPRALGPPPTVPRRAVRRGLPHYRHAFPCAR